MTWLPGATLSACMLTPALISTALLELLPAPPACKLASASRTALHRRRGTVAQLAGSPFRNPHSLHVDGIDYP